MILLHQLHFFFGDLCTARALGPQAHTHGQICFSWTISLQPPRIHVHKYTHILTVRAHLVSRMALMNADLLAASTGALLVLMTGAFLGSRVENGGERMQSRGYWGVTESIQQELHVCVNKWPKGGRPAKGRWGHKSLPQDPGAYVPGLASSQKRREVTAISPSQEWVRVLLPLQISQWRMRRRARGTVFVELPPLIPQSVSTARKSMLLFGRAREVMWGEMWMLQRMFFFFFLFFHFKTAA